MKSSEIHIFLQTQKVSSDMSWWFHSRDDLIKNLPMGNSMWVALCKYFWKPILCIFSFKWLTGCEQHWRFFWKAVSSHLTWPTGSEWHWTFCERQSHHIFSFKQKLVSDIGHFVKDSLISYHIFSFDQQLVSDIGHFLTCILSSIYECLIFHYTQCISGSEHVSILPLQPFYIIIIIDCKISFQLDLFTFLGLQVSDTISWGINYHISLHASL